ncbi:MAG: hypothetical protein NUV51_13395 [Sulfuricaulis sp.]|nr:hypothetical protein [Sulfuricaulis sp.]
MRPYPLVILIACLIGIPAAHAAKTAPASPLTLSVGVESFDWREYSGGQRLLRETGPRLTIGLTLNHLLHGNLAKPYALEFRGYVGFIDYDGQTQAGVPVQTDVDYFGFTAEYMGAHPLRESPGTNVLFGLGVDTWMRDIQDGIAANGTPAFGYQEDYFVLYGKLGPGFLFQSGARRFFLQFGIKYPFYTYERAYLSTVGYDDDVDLKPGKKISGFAKWQMIGGKEKGKSRFGASLYYDSHRFSTSAAKTVSAGGTLYSVRQPESRMDVLGASLEYFF